LGLNLSVLVGLIEGRGLPEWGEVKKPTSSTSIANSFGDKCKMKRVRDQHISGRHVKSREYVSKHNNAPFLGSQF
jgi:hypothetical protein